MGPTISVLTREGVRTGTDTSNVVPGNVLKAGLGVHKFDAVKQRAFLQDAIKMFKNIDTPTTPQVTQ